MGVNKEVFKKVETIIDCETGEIKGEQVISISVPVKDQEEFFFIFAKHLGTLLKLNGNEIKVLLWCSMNCTLNHNLIVITSTQKREIAEYAGLKPQSIANAINLLKKKNIFISQGRCTYKVNSELCWKGSPLNRNKDLKMIVDYKIQTDEQK
jgi:hypothetical protein